MAHKGYNGTILSCIYDVTNNLNQYVLLQSGKKYTYYSDRDLMNNMELLLDDAIEDDNFIYWYNSYLLEEC